MGTDVRLRTESTFLCSGSMRLGVSMRQNVLPDSIRYALTSSLLTFFLFDLDKTIGFFRPFLVSFRKASFLTSTVEFTSCCAKAPMCSCRRRNVFSERGLQRSDWSASPSAFCDTNAAGLFFRFGMISASHVPWRLGWPRALPLGRRSFWIPTFSVSLSLGARTVTHDESKTVFVINR